ATASESVTSVVMRSAPENWPGLDAALTRRGAPPVVMLDAAQESGPDASSSGDFPAARAEELTAPNADVAEPIGAESDVAESDASESVGAESVGAESDVAEPDAPETDAPESDVSESDVSESDVAEPDAPESVGAESDTAESDTAESDTAESDARAESDVESVAAVGGSPTTETKEASVPVPTRVTPRSRRTRILLAGITICAVIGVGGVAVAMTRDGPAEPSSALPAPNTSPSATATYADPADVAEARRAALRYTPPPPPPETTYNQPQQTRQAPNTRPSGPSANPSPLPQLPPLLPPVVPPRVTIPNPIPGLPPIVLP
ncbi:hypothetical protein GORHZ_243_00220, partial [Gordonia rhizosphera NBRC 16068]